MRIRSYESIRALAAAVSDLVAEGRLDPALRLVSRAVERIVTEPLCAAQVYGSSTLDALCQQIGEANLAAISDTASAAEGEQDGFLYVYIVTKLQRSGGHTRIIEEFIEARPQARHLILSTELNGKSEADYLLQGPGRCTRLTFEGAPQGDYQQRLTWLQGRLLGSRPARTYLFNHHQDSVAVAAIQPRMNLEASFYHHGDHHLCLGVYLAHLEHIDPHPMGYHNCRDVLGIDNTHIPFALDDKGARPADRPFLERRALTTCTAARSNKIEIPYFASYIQVLPALLQATGGVHVHIGRLTPWALFRIRRGLRRAGIDAGRFVYIPWVPSVWRALHEHRVDLYIASFPYGGGLTSIEAMGAGVPVALHRHLFSQMLSGIELGYPGVFSWRSPDELLAYCARVGAPELAEAGRLGRAHFERYHLKQNLRALLDADPRDRIVPDALTDFVVERDEWGWWMAREVGVRQVLGRAAYRAARRLRAWL